MNTKRAAFDIDGTLIEERSLKHDGYVLLAGKKVPINPTFVPSDDTLVNLREAVGSINPASGLPWGRDWDHQCKMTHELTFEQHLALQFEDVLERITVQQAIELAMLTTKPKPGARTFLRKLVRRGVQPVFATNGADLIASAVMASFFGDVVGTPHVIANKINNGRKFSGLHGDCGLAKDVVVRELGNVVLFAGDSGRGDGPGALATAQMGGHVFAVGHTQAGSLAHYCSTNLPAGTWSHLTSYRRGGRVRMTQNQND